MISSGSRRCAQHWGRRGHRGGTSGCQGFSFGVGPGAASLQSNSCCAGRARPRWAWPRGPSRLGPPGARLGGVGPAMEPTCASTSSARTSAPSEGQKSTPAPQAACLSCGSFQEGDWSVGLSHLQPVTSPHLTRKVERKVGGWGQPVWWRPAEPGGAGRGVQNCSWQGFGKQRGGWGWERWEGVLWSSHLLSLPCGC